MQLPVLLLLHCMRRITDAASVFTLVLLLLKVLLVALLTNVWV